MWYQYYFTGLHWTPVLYAVISLDSGTSTLVFQWIPVLAFETATNAILNSQNLLEEQGLDLPQDLKAVCPTLLFLLLSFPLTINDEYRPSDAI